MPMKVQPKLTAAVMVDSQIEWLVLEKPAMRTMLAL